MRRHEYTMNENTNTELTVLNNNNEVVTTQLGNMADMTGLSGFGLKPANLNLVQNTTRKSGQARPGQLLDTLAGVGYDTMDVVPLKVMFGRVLFPPGNNFENVEPICRSNDGLVPAPTVATPQAASCKRCQYSQWVDGKKSACNQTMTLLLIDRATMLPYRLQVKGTSISVLRQTMEQIQRDIHINKMKTGAELNLFDYYFTISGEKVQRTSGIFFVLKVNGIKRVANPGEFGPLFEQFVAAANAIQQEEDVEVAEQAVPVTDPTVHDAEPVEI